MKNIFHKLEQKDKLLKGCKFSLETQKKINAKQKERIALLEKVAEAAKASINYDRKHYLNNKTEYSDRAGVIVDLIEALNQLDE